MPAAEGEGTLPFALTASGVLSKATWPSELKPEALEALTIPVLLQVGGDVPLIFEKMESRMMFSSLNRECLDKVAFTIVGKGNLATVDGKSWTETLSSDACSNVDETTPKREEAVVFIESLDRKSAAFG